MSTANQHRPNDFTPVVGAMELAEYVFHITENPSKFPDFALREKTREVIAGELAKVGMHLHPKKTRIYPLTDGIPLLGFTFRLTDTGWVVRIIDPKNPKHERKKLRRMAAKVKKGEMTMEKFHECYQSWKAHAELGNSLKLLRRMDRYAESLFLEGE